jgi:hypothetical protein
MGRRRARRTGVIYPRAMARCALGIAVCAACGHAPSGASAHAAVPSGDLTCPIEVPGTSVAIEDTDHGAALVFVTTGDVWEVFNRANTFAAMHQNPNHKGSAGDPDEFADMIKTPSSALPIHDSRIPENFVRIEFSATKPDDVAALQAELRVHAHHLAPGTCKMAM